MDNNKDNMDEVLEESLIKSLQDRVHTVADNIESAEYVQKRYELLKSSKEEEELPEAKEGMPSDEFIKSMPKGKNFDNKVRLLTDSLYLKEFLEEILPLVNNIPLTEHDVKSYFVKANKHIMKLNVNDHSVEASLAQIVPLDLENYFNTLKNSIEDKALLNVIYVFMVAFAKLVNKTTIDKLFYYRSVVTNLLNIPLYNAINNELGISESKIYINSLNHVLDAVQYKLTTTK